MWPVITLILGALFIAAVICCVWLAVSRGVLADQRNRLQQEVADSGQQIEACRSEIRLLEQTAADSDRKRAVAEQTSKCVQEQVEKAQSQLREAFKALAGDVLAQSSRQFLTLAKQRLENEQKDAVAQLEQRKQAIGAMVTPIKESLDKYRAMVQQIEVGRQEAYGSLKQQVASMITDQRRLQQETSNLVQALRRPEVRGRWGEMQLRRVAELAGMIKNCDFAEQVSVGGDDGVLRPDMTVHLPSERTIVVDAKTPLDAFINAIECAEDDQRGAFFEQHAGQIETQVKMLASKQYAAQFTGSPDFVVLFIPGEGFLQAAVQIRPQLIEQAMAKGVVIATPTTLIVLLKAVAMGWREQRFTENARQLGELAQGLHGRLATALAHVGSLGKAMGLTVAHFNRLVGSLEGSVLPQARRFKEFGADSSKALPNTLVRVDATPRKPVKVQLPLPAGLEDQPQAQEG